MECQASYSHSSVGDRGRRHHNDIVSQYNNYASSASALMMENGGNKQETIRYRNSRYAHALSALSASRAVPLKDAITMCLCKMRTRFDDAVLRENICAVLRENICSFLLFSSCTCRFIFATYEFTHTTMYTHFCMYSSTHGMDSSEGSLLLQELPGSLWVCSLLPSVHPHTHH